MAAIPVIYPPSSADNSEGIYQPFRNRHFPDMTQKRLQEISVMKKFGLINTIAAVLVLQTSGLYAATVFSGYAGGKVNYSAGNSGSDTSAYDPDLKLQAFFAGQFNFSKNIWGHLEFSIDTGDLLSRKFFSGVDSKFKVDEVSMTFRNQTEQTSNYLSVFMGTYDPIGSDVFLQRYFGITPISSKITESWLGLSGSILYPHFGAGVADVLMLHTQPLAGGLYVYLNNEQSDDDSSAEYFMLNTDIRFACSFRYLTVDFATGLGIPLKDKYNGADVFVVVDTIYWHIGTTLLAGNNYTNSFFMQAGLFNGSFTKLGNSMTLNPEHLYLLAEPRFLLGNSHLNISLFSLPSDTAGNLLLLSREDTFGIDMNMYCESLFIGSKLCTVGTHVTATLPGKHITDIGDMQNLFSNGVNVNLTPYLSTNFLSGELHTQFQIKFSQFARSWYNAFAVDIGYRTRF